MEWGTSGFNIDVILWLHSARTMLVTVGFVPTVGCTDVIVIIVAS
jgi:hypothetical protein